MMKFKNYAVIAFSLFACLLSYHLYNVVNLKKPCCQKNSCIVNNSHVADSDLCPCCQDIILSEAEESQIVAAFQALDNNASQNSVSRITIVKDQDIVKKIHKKLQKTKRKLKPDPFQEFEQKVFVTQEDKAQLFKNLCIEYNNDILFEIDPTLLESPFACSRYQNDKDLYDTLSEEYKQNVIENTLLPMSIRWISPEVGYGVFAEQDIEKGQFVGIYGGIIRLRNLAVDKDYAWSYPV